MKIYRLSFYYDYGAEAIDECILWLACYKSLKKAENSLNYYRKKKGFNLFSKKYFYCESFILDEDSGWEGEFVNTDDPNWDYEEKNYQSIKEKPWISSEYLNPMEVDKVYMVVHETPYGELNENKDVKFIGFYSSIRYAEDSVNRHFTNQGFNRRPKSYFKIIPFILDQDMYYENGFTPIYNPTEYDYRTEITTTIEILKKE